MDKTLAGLIGAVTAAAAVAPSQAATPVPGSLDTAMEAHSYADLLTPIPNALALLRASSTGEARPEPVPPAIEGQAPVQEVQYHHHHHHHHHHHRRYHHHHHHHHSYGY